MKQSYRWQDDPVFSSMDPIKYRFLTKVLSMAEKQDPKKLGPFFGAAIKKANDTGIQFTDEETAHLLQALSAHMTPEEKNRMQMVQNMMQKILQNRKP